MADEQIVLDPSGGGSATNLVTNPSFETNATNWGTYNGGGAGSTVITRVADSTAPQGGYVLEAVCTNVVNAGNPNANVPNVVGITPLAPGERAFGRGCFRLISGSPTYFRVGITYLSAVGGYLGEYDAALLASPVTGVWYDLAGTPSGVAPASTAWAQLTLSAYAPASGGPHAYTYRVDAGVLVCSVVAGYSTAYFDGDTVGYPTDTYAWTGTPHASASTRTSKRTELDISSGAIKVLAAGIDWGDSEITTYMAEQQRGEAPVDYRIPNRHISIPLKLSTSGTVSFDQARQKLQSKVARLQQEGGWIKRVTNTAGTVFADVVNATLHLPHSWMAEHKSIEIETTLALECIPDFYGAEIQQADHTETSAAELVFNETSLKGNYPARVRVVVDEDQGVDQLGLIWSFRSRYYSSASTAATAYEAESLTALDTATKTALSGASGGTVVQQAALSNAWTPVLGTNLAGTAFLTHQGTNRIFARVYSVAGTTVQARFVWDVGDLVNPAENPPWTFPGDAAFYIADLGEVHLDAVPIGSHRWQGQIQAKGVAGGEDFCVDKVWIVNSDEGMGILQAPSTASTASEGRLAWDTFTQTAGTITGKVAPLGGTWTGAGDADDFSLDTTNHWIQRTAVSDSATTNGRYARLGTGVATTTTVQVDLRTTSTYISDRGVFARYVDVNNWLMATLFYDDTSGDVGLRLRKRVSGTVKTIGSVVYPALPVSLLPVNAWLTLQLNVRADGTINVYLAVQGAALGSPLITVAGGSQFTSGGVLDDGGYGIYDAYTLAPAQTRLYDNFLVTAPVAGQVTGDAVIYASRSAQLCWNGHFRQDSGGTAYGPVSQVTGDLPRLPPSGLEGRTTELFVKASRGDLDQLPDSGIDDISARVNYRPSWLFIPE